MFGHMNLNFANDRKFHIYKCSLCHTLGKEYGTIARVFTNYDLALCLLVAFNYGKEGIKVKRNICPVFSINKILNNELPLLRYAAAVTILLALEKIKDDIYDEGKKYPKKVMRWIESLKGKATCVLKDLRFEVEVIEKEFKKQRMLEKQNNIDLLYLTEPTATVMSEIYTHSATLAGIPEYKIAFRRIGYSIGQMVYLLDSIADYKNDLIKGTFNPLHRYFFYGNSKEKTFITENTKEKVLHLLKTFQGDIESALQELPYNFYMKDIFTTRLTKKLENIFGKVEFYVQPETHAIYERIRDSIFLSILFSPRFAFASGKEKSFFNECIGNLLLIIIMLIACSFICKGPFRKCFSSSPDKVTVDHGCEGKRTYKKRHCSDEYEDERNKCC